ncbi:hypothetical protein B1A99_34930 [Cohnella sp. CIP 111063]|uniref:hypothetical protein n=1 Tax=unclassified Cohnella TaxID=2636738 RepID=UPI000B8BFDC0|nr:MULTISPECIES: hypothetical protein [unclassified Cohnella]OXS52154.1 hypothetical protein B1A99_34930 [Cohnella sp. CIP 111063]PRX53399.1 hypothetical protein B0G52_1453 [Cohnella sp. SGD-V74]
MKEEKIHVLIKAWETYQNLSKGFGENAWKIRTMGIGFWSAIIAYGYQKNNEMMYYLSIIIVMLFFLLESGMRLLQQKYIEKSIEMEKSINDYLVDDEIQMPEDGISTNVLTPTIFDFFKLFKLKRWMFWFPYLILLISSFFLKNII